MPRRAHKPESPPMLPFPAGAMDRRAIDCHTKPLRTLGEALSFAHRASFDYGPSDNDGRRPEIIVYGRPGAYRLWPVLAGSVPLPAVSRDAAAIVRAVF